MHAILARITRARRAVPTHAVRRVALATLSLTLGTLAACSGGGDATGPDESGRGTLRLSNESSISAYYVYVKSCSASSWGVDRMGDGVLSAGESATLGLDTGCYDVRAESSNANNKRFEQRGLQITNEQTTQVSITTWQDK